MSGVLIKTKFFAPLSSEGCIARPRLTERLEHGLGRTLTLAIAPAGYGKTTLISHWLHERQRAFSWISLDEGDNDPIQFWSYVITALQTQNEHLGKTAQTRLTNPEHLNWNEIVSLVINGLVVESDAPSEEGPEYVLVLDDYHVIQNPEIHKQLNYLLDLSPPSFHLIITSRVDPPLSLPKRRGLGEINELRVADLRFNIEESHEFLNNLMGLSLRVQDVNLLDKRTEGWVTSLRLAALSLTHVQDRAAFINAFSGDDRHVVDYLMDEVFELQTEEVQQFMMCTSILDRFCASLCTSLFADSKDGDDNHWQEMLESLERTNLFLAPLDNRRKWYRYHHLMADLLRSKLQRSNVIGITSLHRHAGVWFAGERLFDEAIKHMVKAGEIEHAIQIVEREGHNALWNHGEIWKSKPWANHFPDEAIQERPGLCILFAWHAYGQGNVAETDYYLDIANAHLPTTNKENEPDHETAAFPLRLAKEYKILRALSHLRKHTDPNNVLVHEAFHSLSERDGHIRSIITLALGEAHLSNGNTIPAKRAFEEGMALGKESNKPLTLFSNLFYLLTTLSLQGQLKKVYAICTETLQRIEHSEDSISYSTGMLHLFKGLCELNWNNLDEAERLISDSIQRFESQFAITLLFHSYRLYSRLLGIKKDYEKAHMMLDRASQIEHQFGPIRNNQILGSTKSTRALLWLMEGRVEEAEKWANHMKFSANDIPNFQQENDYLIFTRLLIAREKNDEVLHLLETMYPNAEQGGRMLRCVEMQIMKAQALYPTDKEKALQTLSTILPTASKAGIIRLFLNGKLPIARLIHQLTRKNIDPDYMRKVLSAFTSVRTDQIEEEPIPNQSQLIEPLSKRENDVLNLLVDGYSNREICDKLFISSNTTKTHIRNIYAKLGVNSRYEAIAQANALGLVAPDRM